MGVEMRAKSAHLLRNLVFMQELDRLFFKNEVGVGTIPAALGFRTYAQDKVIQMRSRYYDLNGQIGDLKNVITLAGKKYGADSGITRQAEERLQVVLAERERVKADLLSVDPNALSTRKPGPAKPKPFPTTIQGLKRSVSIERLMKPYQPKPPGAVAR